MPLLRIDLKNIGVIFESHTLFLFPPGVLKGVSDCYLWSWILLFRLGRVLKWWTVVTNWLQVSVCFSCISFRLGLRWYKSILVPIFLSLSLSTTLSFMPYCLFGKNLTCSLTLRTRSSLALWAQLKCSFCMFWISRSHRRILCMLTGLWGQGMTAPCVGHPCKIPSWRWLVLR